MLRTIATKNEMKPGQDLTQFEACNRRGERQLAVNTLPHSRLLTEALFPQSRRAPWGQEEDRSLGSAQITARQMNLSGLSARSHRLSCSSNGVVTRQQSYLTVGNQPTSSAPILFMADKQTAG